MTSYEVLHGSRVTPNFVFAYVCKVKNDQLPPLQEEGQGGDGVAVYPLLATPKVPRSKRIKKRNLSEPQASLFRFPLRHACFWVPAQRASTGGRRLLLTFLGETRKVSGPPGPVPASLFGELTALYHRRHSATLDSRLRGNDRLMDYRGHSVVPDFRLYDNDKALKSHPPSAPGASPTDTHKSPQSKSTPPSTPDQDTPRHAHTANSG